ncbi:MAG TPA: hypothetical protein VN901_00130 [Candidatus Acidoferrales bacterium]|nr:hypothetical protein [Candidatus Acidoferrales bacterium]
MGGEGLEQANLGWYGLEGDRRMAFRQVGDRGGMPQLTASKLPDLERGFVAKTGDVEKLRKLLGHAPRRYEDFAAETAALWK